MTFTYYDNEITVTENGYFQVTVDGREQTKDTLAELKAWIDKEIAVNVKKITISLPVCGVARHKDDGFSLSPRVQAIRTLITGVNRQTGNVQCKDTPADFSWQFLLPDSDENFALCEQYAVVAKQFSFLQRVVRQLTIDGPSGRIDAPHYQGVLDTLTKKHQEKSAESPKVHEAVAKWRAKGEQ
jgi:hypothetical protein